MLLYAVKYLHIAFMFGPFHQNQIQVYFFMLCFIGHRQLSYHY